MLDWHLFMFTFSCIQTLSGDDVPGIESIDSQISDVDPQSRTWGRRMVKFTHLTFTIFLADTVS